MYKNIGHFFIENGQKKDASAFKFTLKAENIIYEVMRVIKGRVLFLDDHMTRLKASLDKVHEPSEAVEEIKQQVLTLVKGHDGVEKNIKIDVYNQNYRVYFMESFYPEKLLYTTGVKTTLYHHNRLDPEVKKLNMSYKAEIEKVKDHRFFEVLLVNDADYITEGSRANLLFVKDGHIISTPLHEILNGITFKNVIEMCLAQSVPVIFESVHLNRLGEMDACFLTGTSLGILPICSIDDYTFDSANHPVVKTLIKAYNGSVL